MTVKYIKILHSKASQINQNLNFLYANMYATLPPIFIYMPEKKKQKMTRYQVFLQLDSNLDFQDWPENLI
jgi:hypothetical protein